MLEQIDYAVELGVMTPPSLAIDGELVFPTLPTPEKLRVKLAELLAREIEANPISVADHCFGCTAGQGSSCGGALAD